MGLLLVDSLMADLQPAYLMGRVVEVVGLKATAAAPKVKVPVARGCSSQVMQLQAGNQWPTNVAALAPSGAWLELQVQLLALEQALSLPQVLA